MLGEGARMVQVRTKVRPALAEAASWATGGPTHVRTYNPWVANETLEDYALRFTRAACRSWSPVPGANTALGAVSFLALEAIGGALTLTYGFDNAVMRDPGRRRSSCS